MRDHRLKEMMMNKKIAMLGVFLCVVCCAGYVYAAAQTKTLTLTFNVEPVTLLKVTSQSGGNNVEIGPVISGIDVPVQSLEVVIVTNTSQPYRVYHELGGELTNRSGGELPNGELSFMASSGKNGGTSEIPSMTMVPRQRTLIFTSKPEGGPDRFTLQYSLKNKKIFGAGDYYGNIRIEIE